MCSHLNGRAPIEVATEVQIEVPGILAIAICDAGERGAARGHERNLAVAVLATVITLVTLTLGRRRESQPPPAAVEELPAPVPAETRKERQWTSV